MSVVPEQRAEILTKKAFGHVATLGPDGEPQANPVWIDWDGECLKISQTPDRQKVRNLARDARVAVSILDPDDPYKYVEIRGVVDRIEQDPGYAFINKMAQKYLGEREYPWLQEGEERVVVHIRPEHTTMQ